MAAQARALPRAGACLLRSTAGVTARSQQLTTRPSMVGAHISGKPASPAKLPLCTCRLQGAAPPVAQAVYKLVVISLAQRISSTRDQIKMLRAKMANATRPALAGLRAVPKLPTLARRTSVRVAAAANKQEQVRAAPWASAAPGPIAPRPTALPEPGRGTACQARRGSAKAMSSQWLLSMREWGRARGLQPSCARALPRTACAGIVH